MVKGLILRANNQNIYLVLLFVLTCLPINLEAQEAVPAVDLQNGAIKEEFVLSGQDLDTANQELIQAEDDILKRLDKEAGLASSASAVVLKTDKQAKEEKASATASEKLSYDESINSAIRKQLSDKVKQLKTSNGSLDGKLSKAEKRLKKIKAELESTRNRLIIAESEVERLNQLLEIRNKNSLARVSGQRLNSSLRASLGSEPAKSAAKKASPKTSDMLIATVTARKANLRTGPGPNHSPLMTVAKGTRLAVETRRGSWYRIIAPTGVRAWISSDIVAFGKKADSSPTRTVSVKGYDQSIEDEAFKLIKNHSK